MQGLRIKTPISVMQAMIRENNQAQSRAKRVFRPRSFLWGTASESWDFAHAKNRRVYHARLLRKLEQYLELEVFPESYR